MENLEKIILTELHSTLDVINPVFERKSKTNRSVHGLCFCLSGKMTYYHGEKEIYSDRNHVVLIPRGATYTYSCTEAGEFPLINFHTTSDFAPSEFIIFEIGNPNDYMDDFKELERIFLIKPRNGHLKAMKIIYSMLLRLHKVELAKESRTFHIIRPAIRYLEDHFSDAGLTNAVLAKQSMISEVYFRRIFKENFGISPKQYIQELRIQKAKNLLHGNIYSSVTAVADETGFTNIYQFSAAFKKATGYTPSEYVRKMENSDE